MFFAYFLAGLVPIVPTIIFDQPEATKISIAAAFIGLFTVGYIKGKIVEHHALRSATELLVIGGVATVIGLIVGIVLKV